MVKNGSLPAREILTGAGPIEVLREEFETTVRILTNEFNSVPVSYLLTCEEPM